MAESEEERKSLLMKVKEESEKVSPTLPQPAPSRARTLEAGKVPGPCRGGANAGGVGRGSASGGYRTVLWTLWERERVGRFGRMALKHI